MNGLHLFSLPSDDGISGIMPCEVSIIRNEWTPEAPARRPFIPDNGRLVGHYPLLMLVYIVFLYMINNNKKNKLIVLLNQH